MFISIQQPEFFPWLGFFDKARQVQKVVILDSVQFKKRYFENRNKVRTSTGSAWINVPVLTKGKFKQNINEVKIDNSQDWQRKISQTLKFSYQKAPYWEQFGGPLLDILSSQYSDLVELNIAVIKYMLSSFGLEKEMVLSSALGQSSSGSELILDICQSVQAKHYLSGRDGKNYLEESAFNERGIELSYQDFKHPEYSQIHGSFLSHMSAVDLLLNQGEKSLDIISGAQS